MEKSMEKGKNTMIILIMKLNLTVNIWMEKDGME